MLYTKEVGHCYEINKLDGRFFETTHFWMGTLLFIVEQLNRYGCALFGTLGWAGSDLERR